MDILIPGQVFVAAESLYMSPSRVGRFSANAESGDESPSRIGCPQQGEPDGGQEGYESHIYDFKDERGVCNGCQIIEKLTKRKLRRGFCDENDCMVTTSPRNGGRWRYWLQKLCSLPVVFLFTIFHLRYLTILWLKTRLHNGVHCERGV